MNVDSMWVVYLHTVTCKLCDLHLFKRTLEQLVVSALSGFLRNTWSSSILQSSKRKRLTCVRWRVKEASAAAARSAVAVSAVDLVRCPRRRVMVTAGVSVYNEAVRLVFW